MVINGNRLVFFFYFRWRIIGPRSYISTLVLRVINLFLQQFFSQLLGSLPLSSLKWKMCIVSISIRITELTWYNIMLCVSWSSPVVYELKSFLVNAQRTNSKMPNTTCPQPILRSRFKPLLSLSLPLVNVFILTVTQWYLGNDPAALWTRMYCPLTPRRNILYKDFCFARSSFCSEVNS